MDNLPIGSVSHIQNMLRKISFHDDRVSRVIPDGLYGSQTTDSVSSFQRAHGLPETGEVDNDTWDKIVAVYDEVIKDNEIEVCVKVFNENGKPIVPGDINPSLYVIQAMMFALAEKFTNLGKVFITGVYDAPTSDAVRRIQIVSGITPNDTIDREFVNALSELYNIFITRNRVENQST